MTDISKVKPGAWALPAALDKRPAAARWAAEHAAALVEKHWPQRWSGAPDGATYALRALADALPDLSERVDAADRVREGAASAVLTGLRPVGDAGDTDPAIVLRVLVEEVMTLREALALAAARGDYDAQEALVASVKRTGLKPSFAVHLIERARAGARP